MTTTKDKLKKEKEEKCFNRIMWILFTVMTIGTTFQGWHDGDTFLKVMSFFQVPWCIVGFYVFIYKG